MTRRTFTRKLTGLGAVFALAACGAPAEPDTEVQGVTVEDPVDETAESASATAETDAAEADHEGSDTPTDEPGPPPLSELQADAAPWELLPEGDRPTGGSTGALECTGGVGEVAAC